MIDSEAVILGVDGISDFNALHSGKHNDEVQLCAFDVLALDGEIYSARRASLGSKVWFQSIATGPIRAAGPSTGSR